MIATKNMKNTQGEKMKVIHHPDELTEELLENSEVQIKHNRFVKKNSGIGYVIYTPPHFLEFWNDQRNFHAFTFEELMILVKKEML